MVLTDIATAAIKLKVSLKFDVMSVNMYKNNSFKFSLLWKSDAKL